MHVQKKRDPVVWSLSLSLTVRHSWPIDISFGLVENLKLGILNRNHTEVQSKSQSQSYISRFVREGDACIHECLSRFVQEGDACQYTSVGFIREKVPSGNGSISSLYPLVCCTGF